MIGTFSSGKVPAGIICIIGLVFLGGDIALDLYILICVYRHFRGRGGTDQVRREAMGSATQMVTENPGLAVSALAAAGSASRV